MLYQAHWSNHDGLVSGVAIVSFAQARFSSMSGFYCRRSRSDVYGYVRLSRADRVLESRPSVFKAFSIKWFAGETSLPAGSGPRAARSRSRLFMPALRKCGTNDARRPAHGSCKSPAVEPCPDPAGEG